jgi:hypothetical protein
VQRVGLGAHRGARVVPEEAPIIGGVAATGRRLGGDGGSGDREIT